MDNTQKKQLELLKSFDSICREKGIQYYLSKDTLLYAYYWGIMEDDLFCASVMMTAQNVEKFIDVVEKNPSTDIVLEYWGNSEAYPSYSLRYVDKTTTDFNVLDYKNYKHHGMFIEINILKTAHNTKLRLLEQGVLLDSYPILITRAIAKSPRDIRAKGLYEIQCARKGKLQVKKKLFFKMLEEDKKATDRYCLNVDDGDSGEIPAELLGKGRECEVEGSKFCIPCDAEKVLKILYPKRFGLNKTGEKGFNRRQYFENSVIDADLPYEKIFEALGNDKSAFKRNRRSKFRMDMIDREKRPLEKVAVASWQKAKRTDYKFKMWKYYMPLKAQILELDKAERFDELKEIFRPYDERINDLRSHNLGFSFDEDILQAYLDTLRKTGRGEEADWLSRVIPKRDRQPINITIGE